MYLRLGWVTGQAGLGGALIVVVLSHLISLSTGLSVASIATNRTVGAGGAYFMISRSLGASTGAAIGIPLFLAQALSVTFYIVGFTESLEQLIPAPYLERFPPWMISTAVNLLLTGISLKSAALAIRAQYVVMAAIIVSLVGFFTGVRADFPVHIEWFNGEGVGFGEVFAVFFPAVTGIMAGVGMSGDLKDPRTSIPKGTLAAIGVGFLVYVSFPIWLALNASNAELIAQREIAFDIASVPQLIYVGVWGATLSSALGSILTAPRTLQALALDGIAPRLFAKGSGPGNDPRAGTLLTFALAQAGIFLGDLNAIAGVLTMFFLATYGVTNLASGLERWASSPSFRPTFKVPAVVSLLGAFSCFYVMSVINMGAMVVALLICVGLFLWMQQRELSATYGDARHGLWSALVRSALLRLRRVVFHPLNWRPNLVIMGGDPERRGHLLELGNAIVQDRGIVTYFHLLKGSVKEHAERRKSLFEKVDEAIAADYPGVFYRVDIAEDIYQGAVSAAQSYGVGSLTANSVMLGWPSKSERSEAYAKMLHDLAGLDRSLLLVRHHKERGFGRRKRIHVWWGGMQANGGLMLLLAYLITAHRSWRDAQVKVITVVQDEAQREPTERGLCAILGQARLEAEAAVIVRDGREIGELMAEQSGGADLAILGIRLPSEGDPFEPLYHRMNALLAALPTTILVHSARNFDGEPLLFDEPAPTPAPERQPVISNV
jgi:amino acid transporter